MSFWHAYQHEVARFLRELGFETVVDAKLSGARSSHDVDVLARDLRAGIEVSWIIECKHWKRRVSKDRILILKEIVADTGADKGIIVAENGFQSGAFEAAKNTNVLVTTLAKLRETAGDEYFNYQLHELDVEIAELKKELSALFITKTEPFPSSTTRPGFDLGTWKYGYLSLGGQLGQLERSVSEALRGSFPVMYGWDLESEPAKLLRAKNLREMVTGVRTLLAPIREAIRHAKASVQYAAENP